MESDHFILGNTNTNTLNNGEKIFDKYKDRSKRKSNFGAVPKMYAQIYSTLGLKQLIYKTSYENNMSHLNSF